MDEKHSKQAERAQFVRSVIFPKSTAVLWDRSSLHDQNLNLSVTPYDVIPCIVINQNKLKWLALELQKNKSGAELDVESCILLKKMLMCNSTLSYFLRNQYESVLCLEMIFPSEISENNSECIFKLPIINRVPSCEDDLNFSRQSTENLFL